MTIQSPLVYELCNLASSERHLHHCASLPYMLLYISSLYAITGVFLSSVHRR